MNITLFGATGALGSECLTQLLAIGHQVTVLVRSAEKLPAELGSKITVLEGDALNHNDIAAAINEHTDCVMFAIGVDKQSPENLCTDVTRLIFNRMNELPVNRFVWCGGGSTFVPEDQITMGAKFVRWIASTFMSLRHEDKEVQYLLLQENTAIDWFGVRPLQMNPGPRKESYRLGFDTFSGLSQISFADCAHAMIGMLEDDTWLRKAPIVQY